MMKLRAGFFCGALAVMGVLLSGLPAAGAFGQAPVTPETILVHDTPVTMSLVPGGADPMLIVRMRGVQQAGAILTVDELAQAISQVLDRWEARHALPRRLTIQLGSLSSVVLPLLQARLVRAGANWNPRTGDVRRGSAYTTLPAEALAAIEATPLTMAFTHLGYRLSAGAAAEHVEIGRVNGRGNAHLPTAIGYLPISAVRE